MNRKWKNVLRLLIALVVILFLLRAGRSAMEQFRGQQAAADQQIADVERAISEASDPAERRRLEGVRENLIARRPSVATLHVRWILVALVLYIASLLPAGVFFWFVLRRLGQPVPLRIAVGAQVVGHLGKYIPGKAMVVVIRSSAVVSAGAAVGPATAAVFVETLTMMAVGAALAGLIGVFIEAPMWTRLLAAGIAAISVLPTIPPLMRWLIRHLSRIPRAAGLFERTDRVDWRTLLIGWLLMGATWLLMGVSQCFVIASLPALDTTWGPQQVAAVTAATALAVVVGFVTLLPGGAGIRELILTALLGPVFGLPVALLSAVLMRILSMFGELLAIGGFCLLPSVRSALRPRARRGRTE